MSGHRGADGRKENYVLHVAGKFFTSLWSEINRRPFSRQEDFRTMLFGGKGCCSYWVATLFQDASERVAKMIADLGLEARVVLWTISGCSLLCWKINAYVGSLYNKGKNCKTYQLQWLVPLMVHVLVQLFVTYYVHTLLVCVTVIIYSSPEN